METEVLVALANPQPTTRTPITPTGSPFTYQNTTLRMQVVLVMGGTITLMRFSRDGLSYDTLAILSGGMYLLAPGDRLEVTYLTPPTIAAYGF